MARKLNYTKLGLRKQIAIRTLAEDRTKLWIKRDATGRALEKTGWIAWTGKFWELTGEGREAYEQGLRIQANDEAYRNSPAGQLKAAQPARAAAARAPELAPAEVTELEAYGNGYEVGMKDYARLFAELQAVRAQLAASQAQNAELRAALERINKLHNDNMWTKEHDWRTPIQVARAIATDVLTTAASEEASDGR